MLFEAKYLFDLISPEEISPRYPVILLADSKQTLNKETMERLKDYVAQGGKILACADAPVYQGEIAFDLGARRIGEDKLVPAYLCADYSLETADGMALLIKEGSQTVIEATGECLAHKYSPYFVREGVNFCSHAHTPYDPDKRSPAITRGKDGIYVCADLFYEYAKYGSLNPKQLLLPLLETLLEGKKTVKTNLPTSGKVALYRKGDSLFLHLLYGNTAVRGNGVEVVEDLATLADIRVSLDLPVQKIIRRPSGEELAFTVNGEGRTELCLDRLHCYEVLELK